MASQSRTTPMTVVLGTFRSKLDPCSKMLGEQARIPLLLCLVGFLKEFQPSKPFGVSYMTGPVLNFTTAEVDKIILPMSTYSYMSLVVVVLLLTDLLRYKPVIVVGGLAGVTTYSLLIFGRSLGLVVLSQCTHGLFMASELAYSAYMYTRINKTHYQRVTSLVQTALLLGRALSGLLAQALISTSKSKPYHLYFITLTCQVMAVVSTCFLPRASISVYFHRRSSVRRSMAVLNNSNQSPEPDHKNSCTTGLLLLWEDFQAAFTNVYVFKWSLWWALTMCGFFQLTTYCKVLWKLMMEDKGETVTNVYNGAVEALGTIAGATASLYCGWRCGSWYRKADVLLAVCSLLHGVLLYISSSTDSMFVAYGCYVAFVTAYFCVITIATSEVARNITDDSYGLVFGINTFLALVMQSAMAMAVLSPAGLALPIRTQFVVYAGYHIVIGVLYTIIAIYAVLFKKDNAYTVAY